MSQKLNNSIKLKGSITLNIFDENQNLKCNLQNTNQITSLGFEMYRSILSDMMRYDLPPSKTSNDNQQVSILSNPIQLGAESGDVQILEPLSVSGKQNSTLIKAFYQTGTNTIRDLDSESYGNADSIFKNSDGKKAFFNNKSHNQQFNINAYDEATLKTQQDRCCYTYSINCQNKDLWHTGLKIDIKGSSNKCNYFRVYYYYDNNSSSSSSCSSIGSQFAIESIGKAVFPLINGKPTCRQYYYYYGMPLNNNGEYSYFFDMYPRFCKIPDRITFVFQQNRCQLYKAYISNIQFITHKTPKLGPRFIYLKSSDGSEYYKAPIIKTKISKGSILYYAKIGYKQAVGFDIKSAGLCNAQQNIIYDTEDAQIKIVNNHFGVTDKFCKSRFAKGEQSNNYLTQVSYPKPFTKTQNDRIDIVYKINLQFASDSSNSSQSTSSYSSE